jgi:hypothetical protein
MAAGLSGSINVTPAGDFSNVLHISYKSENIRMGLDIVNQLPAEQP